MKNFVILFFITIISLSLAQVSFTQPVMNEIYSRGVAGNLDWIEIYNPSTSQIDISGYKIYDTGGQSGSKPKKLFPTGAIIPAKGFSVIITDTADFVGDLSGFGLSSSGEKVWLEDAAGVFIDSVNFPAMAVTQTYGRLPDGGAWQLLNNITRGFSNVVVGVNDDLSSINKFQLAQNYPNPFNPSTVINYALSERSFVRVRIYDMLGRDMKTLVNSEQNAGIHNVQWNGDNNFGSRVTSGSYIYTIQAGDFFQARKMLLMK